MGLIVVMLSVTTPGAEAVTISSEEGLQFSQLDLTFTGAAQSNSSYGLAAVDIAALTTATGLSSGYLNISSASGWVVRNMPVESNSGLTGLSTMFDLGNAPGTRVANLELHADLSATPLASFSGGSNTTFALTSLTYNAQGIGAPRATAPGYRVDTSDVAPAPGGQTISRWQSGHPSVDQDTNQCAPASVANSLQWLEDTQGLPVPYDNVPGIRDNSLVGKLDQAMNRPAHNPVASADAMFAGKKGFLDDPANELVGKLIIKRWDGTLDWIINEVDDDENVELVIYWDAGGGHAVDLVGAGKVGGIPWVAWTHDAFQSDTPNGVGTHWFDGGVGWSPVIDGEIVAFIGGEFLRGRIGDAMSESMRPVPEPATWAGGVLGCVVCGWSVWSRVRQRRGRR
ncbi:hypothetical protein Oter_1815 [Opitutus terrae PB90-1]|uniref:Uncharacterized protein n=2 Tax=Opitutus terrae TaxID=107709 RepID=B1ZWY8_OPITP|nr:hypothetical protein Oter_1815 [Opitutus terrae PB90-1]